MNGVLTASCGALPVKTTSIIDEVFMGFYFKRRNKSALRKNRNLDDSGSQDVGIHKFGLKSMDASAEQ